jgi:hypothetical protein
LPFSAHAVELEMFEGLVAATQLAHLALQWKEVFFFWREITFEKLLDEG